MYRSETKTALNKNILYFIRWTAISIVMGTVCGFIGTAFGYGVIYAQRLFKTHSFMLYLMPVVLPQLFPQFTGLDALYFAAPVADFLSIFTTAIFVAWEMVRLRKLTALYD